MTTKNMKAVLVVFQGSIHSKKTIYESKYSTQESINRVVTNEWQVYLEAIEAKVMQGRKTKKHIFSKSPRRTQHLFK